MTSGRDGTRPRVLVVQHEPGAPAALVGEWLAEKGIALDVVPAHDGAPVPRTLDGYDGLLVLGGGMGAWDDDAAPWLPAVRGLLARAAADDRPTWGICLGGQLLAAATGGRVALGPVPELGVLEVTPTPAGRDDPLVATLPAVARVAQFHRDGVAEAPPGAVVLASSPTYPVQAFRLGSRVWGVQFHPEVDAAVVTPWLDDEPDLAEATGRPPSDVVAELRAAEPELRATWRPFTHAWADVVAAAAREGAAT